MRGASGGVSPDQGEGDVPEGSLESEVLGFRHWVPHLAKSAQGSFRSGRATSSRPEGVGDSWPGAGVVSEARDSPRGLQGLCAWVPCLGQ